MKLTVKDIELIINQHILHLANINPNKQNKKIDVLEGLLYRSSGISDYKMIFKIIYDYRGEIIKNVPVDSIKLLALDEVEYSIIRCSKYRTIEAYFDKLF